MSLTPMLALFPLLRTHHNTWSSKPYSFACTPLKLYSQPAHSDWKKVIPFPIGRKGKLWRCISLSSGAFL